MPKGSSGELASEELHRALKESQRDDEEGPELARQLRDLLDEGHGLPLALAVHCAAFAHPYVGRQAELYLQRQVEGGDDERDRDVLRAGDHVFGDAEGDEKAAEVVRAVSSAVRDGENVAGWLWGHWDMGRRKGRAKTADVAAAGLALRGRLQEDEAVLAWVERESETRPSRELLLGVVARMPQERWVEPLRHLMHQTHEPRMYQIVATAWVEQNRVYDADAIVEGITATIDLHESRRQIVALAGNITDRIDSSRVVDLLLGMLGEVEQPPTGIHTWRTLLRLGEVWLPKAVLGFEAAAEVLDESRREILEKLVSADTGSDVAWQTEKSVIKEAAREVAGRLDVGGLPKWLACAMEDENVFVARDAVEMLGWWRHADALPGLSRLLAAERNTVLPLAAARAIGHIGGREATRALLEHPVVFGDDEDGSGENVAVAGVQALREAVTDVESLDLLMRHVEGAGERSTASLVAACAALSQIAWDYWGAQQRAEEPWSALDVEGIRKCLCGVLSAGEVVVEMAWGYLLLALGAIGDWAEDADVLKRQMQGQWPERIRAAATEAALWLRPPDEEGLELVAAAGDLDRFAPSGRGGKLGDLVRGRLLADGRLAVTDIPSSKREGLVRSWVHMGVDDALAVLKHDLDDVVENVVDDMFMQGPPSFYIDGVLNRAMALHAPAKLAERLRRDEWRGWATENTVWFSKQFASMGDDLWEARPELRRAAEQFLRETLKHQNVRVRNIAGSVLCEMVPEAPEQVLRPMAHNTADWRERVAATETARLLDDEAFTEMISQALKDPNHRVRWAARWAEDRRREREATWPAMESVGAAAPREAPTGVPEIFKWKRTLVRAGDDWTLLDMENVMASPDTKASVREWLGKVREDLKKEWKKRTQDYDRDMKWSEA